MTHMRRLSLLLLVLSSASCTWLTSHDDVLFTSDPLGARISIDGYDTGRTTPAKMPIGGMFGFDHEITLTKKGYQPVTRHIYQHTQGYTSKWIDGASSEPPSPLLPIFWLTGDVFFPLAIHSVIVPGELHVKLYREDEPLLGFDVLAARQPRPIAPR